MHETKWASYALKNKDEGVFQVEKNIKYFVENEVNQCTTERILMLRN